MAREWAMLHASSQTCPVWVLWTTGRRSILITCREKSLWGYYSTLTCSSLSCQNPDDGTPFRCRGSCALEMHHTSLFMSTSIWWLQFKYCIVLHNEEYHIPLLPLPSHSCTVSFYTLDTLLLYKSTSLCINLSTRLPKVSKYRKHDFTLCVYGWRVKSRSRSEHWISQHEVSPL